MVKGLIAKKLNMRQVFDSHGRAVPVTRVLVEPNYIIQIKTEDADGYKAVQLGSGEAKRVSKPLAQHIKKAGLTNLPRVFKEFRFDGDVKLGQEIKVDEVFHKGVLVDAIGISKGKGFAGVVKRYGFAGGPRTHGQSDRERAPGSIGATTTPGRVYKGTKMAGHMGADRVKMMGLEIVDIDEEKKVLSIKGSVPGPTGSLIILEKSAKKKKKYHEPEIPQVPHLGGSEEEKSEESSQAGEPKESSPGQPSEVVNKEQPKQTSAQEVKEEANG